MQGIPSGSDGTWVANQGAGFTSPCLLEDSAIYNKNVYLPLYEKMNLSFDIRRSENGRCFPTFFKWVNIIFFAGIIIVASFIWKWRIDWCFTVGCGIWYFSFLGFTFTFITEKITQVFCISLRKHVSPRSSPLGTFRAEERPRPSDRNSILMAQINVYIINPVAMGFQI